MGIIINGDKCDGCRICEQVCTFFHEREFNPRRARIKLVRIEIEYTAAPIVCNQCQECIDVCALEAICLALGELMASAFVARTTITGRPFSLTHDRGYSSGSGSGTLNLTMTSLVCADMSAPPGLKDLGKSNQEN